VIGESNPQLLTISLCFEQAVPIGKRPPPVDNSPGDQTAFLSPLNTHAPCLLAQALISGNVMNQAIERGPKHLRLYIRRSQFEFCRALQKITPSNLRDTRLCWGSVLQPYCNRGGVQRYEADEYRHVRAGFWLN
jgi:hypothetical protein